MQSPGSFDDRISEADYKRTSVQTPQFNSKPLKGFGVSEDEIIAMTYDIERKQSEESYKDSMRSNKDRASDRSTTAPLVSSQRDLIAEARVSPEEIDQTSKELADTWTPQGYGERSLTVISAFSESLQHSEASDEEQVPPVPHKEVSFRSKRPASSFNEGEFALMSSFFDSVTASMKRLETDVTSHLSALTERVGCLEEKVSTKAQDVDNLLDFACSLEDVVKKIEDRLNVGVI